MLTSQQLAEARAHERRRIVTAFVSGSVPEQVAAPPSAGRSLLAGVGVAVLVAAGALVWSVAGAGDRQAGDAPLQQGAVAEDRPDHLQGVRLRTDADG